MNDFTIADRQYGFDSANLLIWATEKVIAQHGEISELTFGELAAENSVDVDVDGAIQSFGFWNGSVAVNDSCSAAIFGGPVVANRQTKFVRLSCRFAIKREFAHRAGAAPLHLLLHSGVREDDVRPIIYVLLQGPAFACGSSAVSHQADWINFQEERSGTTLLSRFREKHVRAAKTLFKDVSLARMLPQQMP